MNTNTGIATATASATATTVATATATATAPPQSLAPRLFSHSGTHGLLTLNDSGTYPGMLDHELVSSSPCSSVLISIKHPMYQKSHMDAQCDKKRINFTQGLEIS